MWFISPPVRAASSLNPSVWHESEDIVNLVNCRLRAYYLCSSSATLEVDKVEHMLSQGDDADYSAMKFRGREMDVPSCVRASQRFFAWISCNGDEVRPRSEDVRAVVRFKLYLAHVLKWTCRSIRKVVYRGMYEILWHFGLLPADMT